MAPELSTQELKGKIVKVARKHFARDGLAGASLKHIAEESGVASSLINYHFEDRDGLFTACTETFARERVEAINRLLAEPKSKDELRVRLEMFVNEMLLSHIDDPDGFEIIQREVKANNPKMLEMFKETMLGAFMNVAKFFAKAQDNGLIQKDLDPQIVAQLFFSATCDTARNDHLGKKFLGVTIAEPKRRALVTQHIVSLFMQGVTK